MKEHAMQRQIFNVPNYLIQFRVWETETEELVMNASIPQAIHRRYLAKCVISCYRELARRYPIPRYTVMFLQVAKDDGLIDVELNNELIEEISDLL
jgi:hypothetical protein